MHPPRLCIEIAVINERLERIEAQGTGFLRPVGIAVPAIRIVAAMVDPDGVFDMQPRKLAHSRMLGDPAKIEDDERKLDVGIFRVEQGGNRWASRKEGC